MIAYFITSNTKQKEKHNTAKKNCILNLFLHHIYYYIDLSTYVCVCTYVKEKRTRKNSFSFIKWKKKLIIFLLLFFVIRLFVTLNGFWDVYCDKK